MDNRILILGWNYGRQCEVPSWMPYEDDRPAPVPDEIANTQNVLPFDIE